MARRPTKAKPYRWPTGGFHSRQYAGGHGVSGSFGAGRLGAGAGMLAPRPAGAPPMAGQPPQMSPPGQPQQASAQFTPDSQYLAEAAQRQFDRSQAMQALTSQAGNDQTDTKEALRRLLQGAPDQRQAIDVGANKAGLFYSGQRAKQRNDFEAGLTRQQGDINLDFQRREQARAAARAAIEQGRPLEEAAALAEAAGRQIAGDTTAADAGALVPTPAVASSVRQSTVRPGRRRPPARRRPIRRPRYGYGQG